MFYLIDEIPNFCPSCGKEHSAEMKRNASADFFAGASSQCNCGVMYQHVESRVLAEASKLNKAGDLHRYV
ncbi:hypothetical protein [Herbaspirillum huttiense]|uniref:hypothetical protein n=1 Tax=Herbaspirillum huttiense TaxID=863372 RepID=UPI0039B109C1